MKISSWRSVMFMSSLLSCISCNHSDKYIYICAHFTFPLVCHCHPSTSLSPSPPIFFKTNIPFFPPFPFSASPTSLIRSLSTEPHVSESIRAESRRGRSFTEVNIKLHQTPRRKKRRKRRGEREPSVPNPPHRSGGDEGNILF